MKTQSTPPRRSKPSAIYRRAAERALINGDGISVLEAHPRLEKEFWFQLDAVPNTVDIDDEARSLGMLLLSEIAKDKERA